MGLRDGARGVELVADRSEYRQGETVALRARFLDEHLAPGADDGVQVIVEQAGGPQRQATLARSPLSPGIFEGSLSGLPAGRYRAWIAAPPLAGPPQAQPFVVRASTDELARTALDARALRAAAQLAGGRYYSLDEAGRLPADLPPGRGARIESLPPQPVWNSPLLASLFVLLLTVEWALRKRCGLL